MIWRKHRSGALAATAVAALALTGTLAAAAAAEIPPDAANNPLLQPIDRQNWVDQAELTWDDYTQIRPDSWNQASTSTGSQSQYKTAVILLQFTDQPFLITQPGATHPFGNPQPGWQPVPPAQVADWYYDYYAVPNHYNGGQTIHGYWMEDSFGKIGVDLQVFGPYTLPGKLHEYGIPDGGFNAPAARYCPQGDSCNKSLRTDGGNLWRTDIGCASGLCGFDNAFYVTAGHDESSTSSPSARKTLSRFWTCRSVSIRWCSRPARSCSCWACSSSCGSMSRIVFSIVRAAPSLYTNRSRRVSMFSPNKAI